MFLAFSPHAQEVTGWCIIYLIIFFFFWPYFSVIFYTFKNPDPALKLEVRLLGSRSRESPEASERGVGWTTSQVRSWHPGTYTPALWVHWTTALTCLTLSGPPLNFQAPLLGVWSGPSHKAWVPVLLPKTSFIKWRSSPEGHCCFFSLPDGAHKQMEAFPCHPGLCHKKGQNVKSSSILSLSCWLRLHIKTIFIPPSELPFLCPISSECFAAQPHSVRATQ